MIQVIRIENRITQRIAELNKQPNRARKLTVRKVAEGAGIKENYLWKIIAGKRSPSQKVQYALSIVLECPVEAIFIPITSTESTCKGVASNE